MVKLLLKKQLLEFFRGFFFDRKRNVRRSALATALYFIGYGVLMVVVLGGMFGAMAFALAGQLSAMNLGWMYFALMGFIGLLFGVFGSVFTTYSSLYLAKDNDLLLAMPIPTRALITSRLLSVYLMGLMYSAVVTLPAAVVWWIVAGPTVGNVLGALLLALLISVVVLLLSCLLGWVVAKVSLRLKNRGLIVVLISLVFFGAYYVICFRAQTLIENLLANAAHLGEAIRGSAYPIYLLGRVGEGDGVAMLLVTLIVALLSALVWWVLNRSFLGIATATGAVSKRVYHEKAVRPQSLHRALLTKELRRFLASPNYMLNCGLGAVFLLVLGVALLWRGAAAVSVLDEVFGMFPGVAVALVITMLCMVGGMTDPAVPAVSLEGKSMWLLQSLPVPAWEALKAKLALQLWITGVPTLFAALCAMIALRCDAVEAVLLLIVPMAFLLLMAALDLTLGTLRADLHWTNETTPIKQSLAVFLALLFGWILGLIPGLGYLLLGRVFPLPAWLGVTTALYLIGAALLLLWLKGKGSRRLEQLT